MKHILSTAAIAVLVARTVHAQGYNVVGFVNVPILPGNNLIDVPMATSPDNTLSSVFSGNNVAPGTTISLWNPSTDSFGTPSVFQSGAWSINLTLEPGTGAELNSPVAATNTFVGQVLNHDGSLYNAAEDFTPPPVFSGSNGTYLLGDASPLLDVGTNIFENILGRLPNVGEQVILLNPTSQTFTTSTYLGNGNWNNVPTLNVGESAFFVIPEPSALALAAFGACAFFVRRRQRADDRPESET